MQENRRSALTFGQLTGEICEEKRVFRNLSLFLLDENKLVYAHVKLWLINWSMEIATV